MKRLRAFWEIEPDHIVASLLNALLEYACSIGNIDASDKQKAIKIIYRLQDKELPKKKLFEEKDFLRKEYSNIDWGKLNITEQLKLVVRQRIEEIQKGISAQVPLAVIFLCGSTLEGILVEIASQNLKKFNQASSAPINKGKNKELHRWSLQSLIEVAHEIGLLDLDVKRHSHSLRNFRNYIHPHQQMTENFYPDIHTAKICWQVLQAAIAQIIKNKAGKNA